MSRTIRRSLFVAVVALVALPFTAIGSTAQEADDIVIRVGKEIVGSGAPSAISVSCVGNSDSDGAFAQEATVLTFDAEGNADAEILGWDIEDGMYVASGDTDEGGQCDFTETDTGGASSTAWSCVYEADPVEVPSSTQVEQAGCAAIVGTGVGPVHVVYPSDQEVEFQMSTVNFVNTFVVQAPPVQPPAPPAPAAGVVARPAFTG